MTLPQWATKVTPLSKILAMIIFVSFPFIGFILGMRYQALINLSQTKNVSVCLEEKTDSKSQNDNNLWKHTQLPTNFSTDGWKTYSYRRLSFKYPSQIKVCRLNEIVYLINEERRFSCGDNFINHFSKNMVGTIKHTPGLFYIDKSLPVPIFSGIAMGTAERFIFANFEYEKDRVILEMNAASEEEFPIFYQILSTAKF